MKTKKKPEIVMDDSILDFFIDEILEPYLKMEGTTCPTNSQNETV